MPNVYSVSNSARQCCPNWSLVLAMLTISVAQGDLVFPKLTIWCFPSWPFGVDQIDQIDQVAQIAQVAQIDQVDQIDQIDQVAQVAQVAQVDQIDQVAQVDRFAKQCTGPIFLCSCTFQ